MKRYLLMMILVAAVPHRTDGQVWKKIKEAAKARVERVSFNDLKPLAVIEP